MVLVGALGIYNIQYTYFIDKPFSDVARVSYNRAMAVLVAKNMTLVRQDIWQGLATGEPSYWQAADGLIDSVDTQFAALKKAVLIPERQAILQEVDGLYSEYKDLYSQIKSLKEQGVPVDREDFKAATDKLDLNAQALEAKGVLLAQSYDVYSEKTIADFKSLLEAFRSASLGIGFLAVFMGIVVWFMTYRSIVPPLQNMTKTMEALARWDLSVPVPRSSYHDEIEAMGKAVEVFKSNAIKLEALHLDLKRAALKAGAERREALRSLTDKFEESVRDVGLIMSLSSHEMKLNGQTDKISHVLADAASKIGSVLFLVSDIATQVESFGEKEASDEALAAWFSGDQVRAVQEETRRALNAICDVASTIDDLRRISSDVAASIQKGRGH